MVTNLNEMKEEMMAKMEAEMKPTKRGWMPRYGPITRRLRSFKKICGPVKKK
jgi:hypothetical protein